MSEDRKERSRNSCDRAREEGPDVSARDPLDVGLVPMAPERVDLSHGVDQTIGEPRVDEAPVVGHLRRKRERRDHPVHLRTRGP